MNIEEFKKYCEKFDDNIKTKWDYDKFEMKCKKCKSKDVIIVDNFEYDEGSGCPTCGYDSYTSGKMIVKCLDCGSAMQVLKASDITE